MVANRIWVRFAECPASLAFFPCENTSPIKELCGQYHYRNTMSKDIYNLFSSQFPPSTMHSATYPNLSVGRCVLSVKVFSPPCPNPHCPNLSVESRAGGIPTLRSGRCALNSLPRILFGVERLPRILFGVKVFFRVPPVVAGPSLPLPKSPISNFKSSPSPSANLSVEIWTFSVER
jgi:hypothetical protein